LASSSKLLWTTDNVFKGHMFESHVLHMSMSSNLATIRFRLHSATNCCDFYYGYLH